MKNNVKKAVATFFIIFCINYCFSQGNWRPGYIVKENGDTLKGLINYKEESKKERILSFKKVTEDAALIFGKKEINEIIVYQGTQELIFKKINTGVDYSEERLMYLEYDPAVKLTPDTIFAQLLVDGKKKLYHYKDAIVGKKHFFITNEDGVVIELTNKRFYFDQNKTLSAYTNYYKKQLVILTDECKSISQKNLENLTFTDKALTKLLLKYNSCIGFSPRNYSYKIEKNKPKFGICAGVNQMSLKVESNISNYGKLKFNNSSGINLGVFMNYYLYRTRKKWSIYNELLMTNYKVTSEGYYIYFEEDDYYKKLVSGEFKASYLKLFSSFRFQNFTSGSIKPFILIGIGNGLALKSSSKAKYETRFYSNIYTEDSTLFDFRKYEFSYFAGAGVNYKKYGIELRYEGGNGMSKMNAVATRTRYLYFLASYKF